MVRLEEEQTIDEPVPDVPRPALPPVVVGLAAYRQVAVSAPGNSATLEYKSKILINYFLHIENNTYNSMAIIALPIMSIYVFISQIFIICSCFCTHYTLL